MPVGLIAAGVGAAGAIGGAIINAGAQDDAASAAERSAKLANKTQSDIYASNKALFKPFVEGGYAALDPLLASYGLKGQAAQDAAIASFHNAPDYQWSLDQGLTGVEKSAAARGGVYSGGALKALQRYGSDYANTYLGNWRKGLGDIVNTGAGGVQQTAGAGTHYADAYGANTIGAGNARASAYANTGQGYASGLQDVGTIAAYGAGRGWFSPANAGGGQTSSYSNANKGP